MKRLRFAAMFMCMLVVSLPFCFATTLSYDANGNLVTGDGKYRVYNEFNQLVAVHNGSSDSGELLEAYLHHPLEERIWMKEVYDGGSLKETVYYQSDSRVTVENDSGSYDFVYVKQNGELVAQQLPDGTKQYIHSDHLGSSTVVTDEAGNVIENTTYKPFGEIASGGEETRFDYEGKEYSSVVGDYDFHFRKYCLELGIFCQPDTLLPNVYDPQQLNRYSFERNNPYKYTDEDGHVLGEIIAVVRYALNPSPENKQGLLNAIVIDNIISAMTGGIYEYVSDAWTLLGLTDGVHEWLYNEEDGIFDDSPAIKAAKESNEQWDEYCAENPIECKEYENTVDIDNLKEVAKSTKKADSSNSNQKSQSQVLNPVASIGDKGIYCNKARCSGSSHGNNYDVPDGTVINPSLICKLGAEC